MRIIKVVKNKTDLSYEKNKALNSLGKEYLDKELNNEMFYSLAKSHYDLEKEGRFAVNSYGITSINMIPRTFGPFLNFSSKKSNKDQDTFLNEYKIKYKSMFKDAVKKSISNIIYKLKIEFITLDELLKLYPNTKNASIGTYTYHPLDSRSLSKLDGYHKDLAIEKDDELILLLQKMGAKKVKILEKDSSDQNNSGKVSGGNQKLRADMNIDNSNISSKQKELVVEFEGNSELEMNRDIFINSIWHKNNPQLNAIYEEGLAKLHSPIIHFYTSHH